MIIINYNEKEMTQIQITLFALWQIFYVDFSLIKLCELIPDLTQKMHQQQDVSSRSNNLFLFVIVAMEQA